MTNDKNLPIDDFLAKDRVSGGSQQEEVKKVADHILNEMDKYHAKRSLVFWYWLFIVIVMFTAFGILIVYKMVK